MKSGYHEAPIDVRRAIAKSLLTIGAVSLRPQEPYTWTSGIKSPMYCDNRLTLSHPLLRDTLADHFAQTVSDHFPGAECIAGTATAGIAHAALIADRLGLPMVYVRNSAKSHGLQNLVEGRIRQSQQVVVVEDTVSTGGSVIAAIDGLRAIGADVIGAMAIYTYGFSFSEEAFQGAGVPLVTLTDFPTLLDMAVEGGYIEADDVAKVLKFREDPHGYGC